MLFVIYYNDFIWENWKYDYQLPWANNKQKQWAKCNVKAETNLMMMSCLLSGLWIWKHFCGFNSRLNESNQHEWTQLILNLPLYNTT